MKKFAIAATISVLTWIVLFFGIYYVALSFVIPEKLTRLDERGHREIGRVTGREASDHQRIDYEFSVRGIRYTGAGRAGGVNANFDDLTLGTSVHVTFDPAEPGNSMLGSPKDDIHSIKLLAQASAFAIPFFPVVILFGLLMAFMHVRKSSPTESQDTFHPSTD